MNDTLRAATWMIGAILSFTLMAIAGRAVALDLDTFEIMMYRSIIGFVVVILVLTAMGRRSEVKARHLRLHGVRNVFHFTGQNLWFYALTVAPLAQVFALEFTSPIWALFLAAIVLGEKLSLVKVGSALVGFAGILIVARPFGGTLEFGVVMAGLSAIGFAGSAVFTRLLTRTESIASILFFLTLMQFALGLICAGFDLDIAVPSLANWPWLVVIALCGLVAHLCLTTALSIAPAAVVMPIDFARLPVISLVGIALYAEPFDPFVLIGAAVIFAANYVNILYSSRQAKN